MRLSYIFATTVAGLLLATAALSGAIHAEDNTSGVSKTVGDADAGILVLQDGGVLTGQITRAADWYVVSRGGGQLQIAQARVMLVCRTLEEAYEYRRQQLRGTKADSHLAVAEWCLRYNLLADAGRELADARRLDPDHPRLALLERRLAKINSPPSAKPTAATTARPQSPIANPTQPTAVIAADLPDGVVERFTRKVQPVLVNNCTTSGCHQPGGRQSFQLDRALLRGEANRRSTTRNLEQALALVNREHPEQSPLLTIPRQKHAGMAAPIFGPRQEQAFKHVADWVALVAPPVAAAPPAAVDETGSTPLEDNAPEESPPPQSNRQTSVQPTAAPDDVARPSLKTPHRLQYGGRLEPWRPRDPFDPEIFNRQQRSQVQAASAEEQTTAEQKR